MIRIKNGVDRPRGTRNEIVRRNTVVDAREGGNTMPTRPLYIYIYIIYFYIYFIFFLFLLNETNRLICQRCVSRKMKRHTIISFYKILDFGLYRTYVYACVIVCVCVCVYTLRTRILHVSVSDSVFDTQ